MGRTVHHLGALASRVARKTWNSELALQRDRGQLEAKNEPQSPPIPETAALRCDPGSPSDSQHQSPDHSPHWALELLFLPKDFSQPCTWGLSVELQ